MLVLLYYMSLPEVCRRIGKHQDCLYVTIPLRGSSTPSPEMLEGIAGSPFGSAA